MRPVNRIKHVVDIQSATVAGTKEEKYLIIAKDAPTLGLASEVQTGCTVNAIFMTVEAVATSSAALPNFYMMVMKNPGDNLSFPDPNQVGTNDNKRYVIHQEMVMFQEQTGSNPRTVFKGVILIPKGYRRFGPGDSLKISVLAPGVSTNWCFQAHYKEFR